MVGKWPGPGAGNHASFAISGLPFASGTVVSDLVTERVDFSKATKFFYVRNTSANPLLVGFTRNGVSGTNRFTVPANSDSPVLEIRVRELFLRAEGGDVDAAEVVAGLTQIPGKFYYSVTGSQFISGAIFLENGVG